MTPELLNLSSIYFRQCSRGKCMCVRALFLYFVWQKRDFKIWPSVTYDFGELLLFSLRLQKRKGEGGKGHLRYDYLPRDKQVQISSITYLTYVIIFPKYITTQGTGFFFIAIIHINNKNAKNLVFRPRLHSTIECTSPFFMDRERKKPWCSSSMSPSSSFLAFI